MRSRLPGPCCIASLLSLSLAATIAPATTPLHRHPPRRCSDACSLDEPIVYACRLCLAPRRRSRALLSPLRIPSARSLIISLSRATSLDHFSQLPTQSIRQRAAAAAGRR